MRKGRNLEKLVAFLEDILKKIPNSTVKSPDFILDRITGGKREHDCVIRIQSGHHEILTAIECKEHSRPIDVKEIEAFETKCRDTNINKAVIVSLKGFTKSALAKANHLGISCLSLEDVKSFEWMACAESIYYIVNFKKISWHFIPENTELLGCVDFTLFDKNGNSIQLSQLTDTLKKEAIKCMDSNNIEKIEEERNFVFDSVPLTVKRNSDGKASEINQATAKTEYSIEVKRTPFKLFSYQDQNTGKIIAEGGVSDFENPLFSGKIYIVDDKNGDKKVYIRKK